MRPPNHHSMLYFFTKVEAAASKALNYFASNVNSSTPSLWELFKHGLEEYNRPLTGLMLLTGNAMAPTLNPAPPVGEDNSKVDGAQQRSATSEKLLVRWLHLPCPLTVFPNDVCVWLLSCTHQQSLLQTPSNEYLPPRWLRFSPR